VVSEARIQAQTDVSTFADACLMGADVTSVEPDRRVDTIDRVRQAAEKARRRQLVEAGQFRQRLSIEDATKGNTTHIDLTPAAGLPD
jgi:hypothetical protein